MRAVKGDDDDDDDDDDVFIAPYSDGRYANEDNDDHHPVCK